MNHGLKIIILTITCLMMVCGAYQASAEEASVQNTNVLNINGAFISQDQFQRELASEINKQSEQSMTEEELQALIKNVLEKIIRNELLYQECQKDGIVIDEAEVDEKINAEKSKFTSDEEYQQSLTTQNKDEAIRKAEIKRNLAIQRLINQKCKQTVTDKEVEKYYKKNSDKYEDVPLEQVEDEIRRQLGKEKIADAYLEFYADVRNKAKVEYLLNE